MSMALPATGILEGGVHRLPLRIYYEDTDAGGVVYHANFVRFFERGRSEMLRALGIDHAAARMKAPAGAGLGFAIRRIEVDYLAPAFLDDALMVYSAVERVAAASVDAVQRVERDGLAIAAARLRIALVDEAGRPARLPALWRERLAACIASRGE